MTPAQQKHGTHAETLARFFFMTYSYLHLLGKKDQTNEDGGKVGNKTKEGE